MILRHFLTESNTKMFTKKYKILGIMFPIVDKNMYKIKV